MLQPEKEWRLLEADPEVVSAIASGAGLSPLLARLLVNRGVRSPEAARAYLQPTAAQLHDPFLLRDMEQAVERLVRAVTAGTRITIHGDYDVDGITATVILLEFLRSLGARVDYFIPGRLRDGYGIKLPRLQAMRAAGTELVVTVDCGIASREEVRAGVELGLDFIITDHHPAATRPRNVPVVNPLQAGCPYPCKELSGAGVVFKLIQGVQARLAAARGPVAARAAAFEQESVLDLVAIGTIADVVPLIGENRVLTRLGLEEAGRYRRPGLTALCEVAGLAGPLTAAAVSFQLAPRLNVAGRLGEAGRSVELFLDRDPVSCRRLARELDAENRLRQELEAGILRESLDLMEREETLPEALVLAADHWHPGVIGIVASRLVERYHRPAALLSGTGDELRGSVRSVPGCSLTEILAGCSECFTAWGGHPQAAGVVLSRGRLGDFRKAFARLAGTERRPENRLSSLPVDLEIDYRQLGLSLAEQLEVLEPVGSGNPPAVFLSRRVPLSGEPQVFGSQHLRFRIGRSRIKVLGFRMAARAGDLLKDGQVDIVYTPQVNRWREGQELTLHLKDLSPGSEVGGGHG